MYKIPILDIDREGERERKRQTCEKLGPKKCTGPGIEPMTHIFYCYEGWVSLRNTIVFLPMVACQAFPMNKNGEKSGSWR